MPFKPRDEDEGVRTRRQADLDESRASAKEGTSTSQAHPVCTATAMAKPTAFDVSALLAAMQDMKEPVEKNLLQSFDSP